MNQAAGGGGGGGGGEVDVDLSALDTIATQLDSGAEGLEGLAGSVPQSVDAGVMTGFVSGLLSEVVTSAGNIAEAMSGSADAVRDARGYYGRSDADADATMAEIHSVMHP